MKTKLFITLSFIISSFLTTTLFGFAPPANDDCVDAIEITGLVNCNMVHVDVSEATSNNLPASNEPDAVDVWYKFTATTNQIRVHGLELNFYNTAQFRFEVYEVTCPNGSAPLVQVNTYHNHEEFVPNLTIGDVYYFRVWLIGGTEADFCIDESCTLEVVSATPSVCNPMDNTFDLDLEIAYLGGTNGEEFFLTTEVFSGDLAFNSVDDTLLFTVNDLLSSGTSNYTHLSIYNSLGRFCRVDYQNLYTEPVPCIDPPVNDSCHQATLISDLTTCNPIHIDLNGATIDSLHGLCDEETGIWYKFTAISSAIEIKTLDVSSYGNGQLTLELYEDICSSNNLFVDCMTVYGESSKNLSNLTIGKEYFLRVYIANGSRADFCVKAACELEIISIQNSICNTSNNTHNLDVEVATQNISIGDSLVFNVNGGPNPSLYKFELTAVSETTTFTIPALQSDNETHYFFLSTQGESFCNYDTFYIAPMPCVSPPANDSCHQATVVDLMNCNNLQVDLTGATLEENLVNPCNGGGDVDVWYKFTAVSPSVNFNLSALSNGATLGYQLYENTCLPINQIDGGGCSYFGFAPAGRTFNNLTIGEDYFLRLNIINGLEAEICLEALCGIMITNHSVSTCDNGDNTYDLTVDVSATGLEIGDSLLLYVENGGGFADQGFKITSNTETFTFVKSGLPSTGSLTSISIFEWSGDCYIYFPDYYTTPSPCISPPVNDDCMNATELTDFSDCTAIHVNGVGATSENLPNSCGDGSIGVWYRFTATSTRMEIKGIEFSDYGNSIFGYEIYTGGCTGLTKINNDCNGFGCEGCTNTINGLTAGSEYYLYVYFITGQEADICLQAQCEMEITNHSISTCDNGDNTYDLTVEVSGEGLVVGDSLILNTSGFGLADTGFKIINTTQDFTFTKTGLPSTGNTVSLFIHAWYGNCTESYYDFYTAPAACVSAPSNDECADAIEVLTSLAPDTFHVSSLRATPSTNLTNSCFSNTSRDVWYKFVATSTRIGIRGIEFSNTSIQELEIYQDGCNAPFRIGSCVGTCENCYAEFENLTIGTEYYLRFPFYGEDIEADISIEALCDIEITSSTVSTCDNGDNTYDLTLEVSATGLEVGDDILLHVEGFGTVGGFPVTSVNDNYTFNANGLASTGSLVTFYIWTLNTSCLEFFGSYYTAPNPCVSGPPNDDCLNAEEILDLSNCNVLHPSTYGANSEGFVSCNANVVDIWYKFTANVAEVEFNSIEFGNYNSDYQLNIEVYSGSCNNLQLAHDICYALCDNGCDFIVNELVLGDTYYVRISARDAYEGDFCVQAVDGSICNENPLLLDMATTNQATYQTQQTITAEGMIPNTDNTTFIAEQSITLMPGFHAQAGAEFHAYIEDCTPASPFVETPAEERTAPEIKQTESTELVQELTVAPNPFRYSTTLKYTLEKSTAVNLSIYAMSGQLVKEIVSESIQQAGNYEYTFEPNGNAGNTYFAVMTTPEQVMTKKLILIR